MQPRTVSEVLEYEREEMLPRVGRFQLERIRGECIREQDAPETDSVKLLIGVLQPSKVLSEKVTGGKAIFGFFLQVSFLLWRCLLHPNRWWLSVEQTVQRLSKNFTQDVSLT